ncbi:MAG: hypothetical protein K0B01_14605, partial [Syntrophobacterales bacterium]|nr:hypothetical protein [Syntrophobacterales bacterium]
MTSSSALGFTQSSALSTQHSVLSTQYSVSPTGEQFPLPTPQEEAAEIQRLQALVADHRAQGHEIVVVLGVGFVGAVMAGIVADSVQKTPVIPETSVIPEQKTSVIPEVFNRESNSLIIPPGQPNKFVIGLQRPSTRSYWKIPLLNRGIAPVEAEDPEVAQMIARCVLDKKTLTATYTYAALCLADVIVVDVQCDYFKETLGNCRQGHAEIAALEESLKVLGEKIQPHCLVLIETTVPPGTTEYVAYPILKKAFERRFGGHDPNSQNSVSCPPNTCSEPLLAHSYERVMPGREYVASIRDFWRVCSGINEPAKEKVVKFLSEILNVEKF